jgi:hypothetical protein
MICKLWKKSKFNSEKYLENTEENWRKVGWIVKWYGKYRRNVSWIMKRYGKYRRKVSWKVKRYGNYGRKVS